MSLRNINLNSSKNMNTAISENLNKNLTLKNAPSSDYEIKNIIETIPRQDIYGNNIIKGSKRHTISFCDQLKELKKRKRFDEIIDVQSYKKYNVDVSKYLNRCCRCFSCVVF